MLRGAGGKLGSDFQDFSKGGVGECVVEGAVDVVELHAVGEAFEDQVDRQAGTSDGEVTTQ